MKQGKSVQRLVFTLEYGIDIEHNMNVDIEGVLEKMKENGSGDVVKVEVRAKEAV